MRGAMSGSDSRSGSPAAGEMRVIKRQREARNIEHKAQAQISDPA